MYVLEIKGVKPTDVKLYPVESGKGNPEKEKKTKSGKKSTNRDACSDSDDKNCSPKCDGTQSKSERKQKDQTVTKPAKKRGCCFMACCSSEEKDEIDTNSDDKCDVDYQYKKSDVCPESNKVKKPREVSAKSGNKNKPKKLDGNVQYKPRNQEIASRKKSRNNQKSSASKKDQNRNLKVPDSDVNEVAVDENETEMNGHGAKKCDSDCDICNPKVGYGCIPCDNCCCKLLCIRRKLNKKGPMKAGGTQTDNILIEVPLEIRKDCGCETDTKQNLTVAISMTGTENKNEKRGKKKRKTNKIK